jgi:tRNA A37 methylthiotransferase MiaB
MGEESQHEIASLDTRTRVCIVNDGCVEGQLSSTYVEQYLRSHNVGLARTPAEADVVILYACGLTQKREEQSLEIIARTKRLMRTGARIFVWGCLPKINPEALREIYDGPIVGPLDVGFFRRLVEGDSAALDSGLDIGAPSDLLVPSETPGAQHGDTITNALFFLEQSWERLWEKARKNSTPFIIRVAKGCTGNCTYCSEHCAFGTPKSRRLENILSDFTRGLKYGYRLFSLMATDLGAYGKDRGSTLPDLLKEMIKVGGKKDFKIVLNQVNPFHLKNLYPGLEEAFESGKIDSLCSPVQSGSDRILRLMRRPHTAEEWRRYMAQISHRFPRIRLSTQFMVGFPTETEEDVRATEKLLDYPVVFDYVHVFKFSRRPHVYAAYMQEQVPEAVKEARRIRLLRRYAFTKAINLARRGSHGIF